MRFKKALVMSLVLVLCVAYSGTSWAATADLTKLVLSKNQATLEIGDTADITATGVYSDSTTANVTIKTSWSSGDTSVATVYNGTITAKSEGTTTITASYSTAAPQSVVVNVTKKVKALTKDVQSLDLKMNSEADIQLTATYTDNTTENVSTKAEWSTDNSNVVTVVNGKAKTFRSGTATITATYGKQTVTIPVSVELVKRLEAKETQISMLLKEKKTVLLTATYPDGTPKDVTKDAEWSSSNEAVADVINGEINAYMSGSAVITAKYGSKSVNIQVDVDKTRKLVANKTDIFMRVGGTPEKIALTAVYPDKTPANVDVTKDAVWTSSNEKIAYVNKGVITAESAGAAIISAKYGDKTVTINVDVEIPRHLELVEEVSMSVNESKTLTLKAKYAGVTGDGEDVAAKAEWKSNKEDIIYVTGGKITAYKKGQAQISATYGGVTVTTNVSVDMPSKIDISAKKVSLKVGGVYPASVVLNYGKDKVENVTSKAEWSSSKSDVATVDENGVVTGVAMGSSTITAKYDNKSYTMSVEVGLVTKLNADVQIIVLSSGEKKQVTLSATDSSGKNVELPEVIWKSSNASIAAVSNSGIVTGNKYGKANITAESGGQKVTIPVEIDVVQKIDATVGKDSNKVSIDFLSLQSQSKDNKVAQVNVTITLSDGSTRDITKQADWTTSSYKVASVDAGKVTAMAYGKTSITAKYAGKSLRIPVDVDTLKYLETDKVAIKMSVGQDVNIVATATYADGTEGNVSKPALWTTSKLLTASVKDGRILATGKGKATITVSFGGKRAKVIVTVE
ncbi:Ig-like domain-containing protein [Paenibacillus pini]|nr:Ig-like domain-containing protein [Paenibacillus pini]